MPFLRPAGSFPSCGARPMIAATDAPPATDRRPALATRDLVVEVPTGGGHRQVVRGVSLELHKGEITALVGETGSGKTMTALAILDLLPDGARRASGRVLLDDQDIGGLSEAAIARIRGRRISMVFQDPMTALNPVLSIGFQISEPMRAHLGLDRRAAAARARDLLGQLGMPDVDRALTRYPHELSGGMRQRVLIALALACDPDVLLADEPTTALDVTIQAQILDLLREQVDRRGLAVLLVTHDLGVAARVADRVAVMYSGRIVETGPVRPLLRASNHPYTRALIACIPRLDQRLRPLPTLPVGERAAWDIEAGCRFEPRCPLATDRCRREEPSLVAVGPSHGSACLVNAPVPGSDRI